MPARRIGEPSDEITLEAVGTSTILRIVVTDTKATTYTLTVNQIAAMPISINTGRTDSSVAEGKELTLAAEVVGDIEGLMFRWVQEELGIATTPDSTATVSVRIPPNFIVGEALTQNLVFELIVTDGILSFNSSKTVTIVKIDNGGSKFHVVVSNTNDQYRGRRRRSRRRRQAVSYVWERSRYPQCSLGRN